MSCPFCETFTCYRRQTDRRWDSGTLSMSEENARRLVRMAKQIRSVTRRTLHRVGNEAVPTILCDLLDGLAQGLMEELRCKLTFLSQNPATTAPTPVAPPLPQDERNGWHATKRGRCSRGDP